MYKVSISRNSFTPGTPFSTDLTISGDVPAGGSISLPLYHVDQGNLNWISLPWYTAGVNNTEDLGISIAGNVIAPVDTDTITITVWDPQIQTGAQTSGDYSVTLGNIWVWDPPGGQAAALGKAYIVSINKADRLPGAT